MQSEAFAPTPQFMQVSRIEDNAELRNRRSSITSGGGSNNYYEYEGGGGPSRGSNGSSGVGDSYGNASSGGANTGVRRQVEQFTEVGALTDDPEMRKRREAYLHDRIMDHSKVIESL